MSSYVLDASAILALIYGEPGAERVTVALEQGAAISAVNWSEVAAKLTEGNFARGEIEEMLSVLKIEVVAFDEQAAFDAGLLRPATRARGLSLGDRACLALAERLGAPALTTDRAWQQLGLGVEVTPIR